MAKRLILPCVTLMLIFSFFGCSRNLYYTDGVPEADRHLTAASASLDYSPTNGQIPTDRSISSEETSSGPASAEPPDADMPSPTPASEDTAEPKGEPALETVAPSSEKSSPEPQESDYVLNLNTKKFHYPDCSSVKTIKEKNREDFYGSRDAVIERSFEPCKICNP